MTKREVKKQFINEVYGNKSNYLKERKRDYCKAQLNFTYFIDNLCKSGIITQKQYDTITF